MIELIESIKESIERDILQAQPLSLPVNIGDTLITVSANKYPRGTQLALYESSANCAQSEIVTVCTMPNSSSLGLASPVTGNYENGFVQPIFADVFVAYVVIGNPPTIPRYPAITIDLVSTTNEPLALRTFAQTHDVKIGVWTDASSYQNAYRLRDKLARRIEYSLFKTVFPLIRPWAETTLIENVTAGDSLIRVADQILLNAVDIYLVSNYDRYPNSVTADLGHGIYQLSHNSPIDMVAGSKVIRPLTYCYDALCRGIDYGSGKDNATLLLSATLNYQVKIARDRYQEPFA